MNIRTRMVRPSQKAEKLPATRPERMFSEAPPWREALTTSSQWRELVLVKTLVNSGISAPAMVPQLMMIERASQAEIEPPTCGQIAEQKIARDEGDDDGDAGGDPDQVGQGMFEVELLLAGEQGLADRIVDEVGDERGDDHQDAHGEDPDDQLAAHGGICGQGQGQKGDQGHAGDAVGLEAVRRGADAVARVVARAVGDDAGVFRIVFRQMEDDLHQVGTDVGDLGEDTAADAQRAGAEGFADGKADEAGAGTAPWGCRPESGS